MVETLRRAGVPMILPVEIVSHASTVREAVMTCILWQLADDLGDGMVANPFIIFIRWPKACGVHARSDYAA